MFRRPLKPLFGRPYSRNARIQYQRIGRFVRGAAAAGAAAGHVASMKRKRNGGNGSRKRARHSGARRRTIRRRNGRNAVVSGQAGNTVNTRYRGRMLSRRGWTQALLSETRFKPHYRSLFTTSFTQVTPVGVNSCTKSSLVTLLPVATPFWTVAGGALPIDATVPVPTFNISSIVLRGGRSEVTIGDANVDACKLKVYTLYVKPGADQVGFNALLNVPSMWDPSHYIDFQQSFKLLASKEYILLPGSRPVAMIRGISAQKIDTNLYNAGEGHIAYCFTIQQLTDIDNPVPANIIFTVSHSVSFVGDTT